MRGLSLILKPLSWLYGLILWARHQLYDRGFFFSKTFDQPIIKIGNLSFGGTGKSPMTICLAKALSSQTMVYILSRGYGRSTRGIQEVLVNSSHNEVGDEPLMMKKSLPECRVFVAEDRVAGIHHINSLTNDKKLIILDDCLQHRRLRGGYEILLTEYSLPFYKDDLFPAGKLRDLKSRSEKVNMVVITKTEDSGPEIAELKEGIKKCTKSPVYHSSLNYLPFQNWFTGIETRIQPKVLAVTAIANPTLFYKEVEKRSFILARFQYHDHYNFSGIDIKQWLDKCRTNEVMQLVMTAKDAVRIIEFRSLFEEAGVEVLVLPVEVYMDSLSWIDFLDRIKAYINQFET
jgi:tetraacyldisaccharide 4'-kinase